MSVSVAFVFVYFLVVLFFNFCGSFVLFLAFWSVVSLFSLPPLYFLPLFVYERNELVRASFKNDDIHTLTKSAPKNSTKFCLFVFDGFFPFFYDFSSHHSFSFRTRSSSSCVKSLTMLKIRRISSGVLPIDGANKKRDI